MQAIPKFTLDHIYRFNKLAMMFGRHSKNGVYCATCEETIQWKDQDYRLDPNTQLFWFCSSVSEKTPRPPFPRVAACAFSLTTHFRLASSNSSPFLSN